MSAVPRAKWYFDFISPFAYVHLKLLKSKPIELEPVPVLFAGLLNAWSNKGPAEIPPKRVHTYRFCVWLAEHHRIPFRFPPVHPFNPLRALRLAIALGPSLETVERIFDVVWGEGGDPESEEGWRRIKQALGAEDGDARVADPTVKKTLADNTSAAAAAGVFGVPSIQLNGEIFWGSDSIAMMEEYLRNPGLFRSPEMARVTTLPIGTARRL